MNVRQQTFTSSPSFFPRLKARFFFFFFFLFANYCYYYICVQSRYSCLARGILILDSTSFENLIAAHIYNEKLLRKSIILLNRKCHMCCKPWNLNQVEIGIQLKLMYSQLTVCHILNSFVYLCEHQPKFSIAPYTCPLMMKPNLYQSC